MEVFLVLPCLNEQENLAATCSSLGFPGAAEDAYLVLVDNGSTDNTANVMREIRSACPENRVLIIYEAIRGYIPARHAGILAAQSFSRSLGIPSDQALILQVDADTIYLDGYISAMKSAGRQEGTNFMLEGNAVTAAEFSRIYFDFDNLCRLTDDSVSHLLPDRKHDALIDDKVSGFLLCDYFSWGEHKPEYDDDGFEILLETTRLFIKAKKKSNANHINVSTAVSLPSRRKVIADPIQYFSSAGLPRPPNKRRIFTASKFATKDFLLNPKKSPLLEKFAIARQAHIVALGGILPILVDPKIESECPQLLVKLFEEIRLCIDTRNQAKPLKEVINLIDNNSQRIYQFLEKEAPWQRPK